MLGCKDRPVDLVLATLEVHYRQRRHCLCQWQCFAVCSGRAILEFGHLMVEVGCRHCVVARHVDPVPDWGSGWRFGP